MKIKQYYIISVSFIIGAIALATLEPIKIFYTPKEPVSLAMPSRPAVKQTPYGEIKKITRKAVSGKIAFPLYEGPPDDFSALRQYITALAVRLYGIDSAILDTPTVLSTSLLRDMVHKVNWQIAAENDISFIHKAGKAQFALRGDIAEMWRYPSRGVCGHISWTLYNIYKSFGYDVERIDSVDAPRNDGTYKFSHVTVQVYVADLQKFIIQDSTYNYVVRDKKGRLLDFYEARVLSPEIRIDTSDFSRYSGRGKGEVTSFLPPDKNQTVVNHYFGRVYSVSSFRNGVEHTFKSTAEPVAFRLGNELWNIEKKNGNELVSVRKKDGLTIKGGFEEITGRALQDNKDVPENFLSTRISILLPEGDWSPFSF